MLEFAEFIRSCISLITFLFVFHFIRLVVSLVDSYIWSFNLPFVIMNTSMQAVGEMGVL